MRIFRKLIWGFIVLALLAVGFFGSVLAQTPEPQGISTGTYSLDGEFLAFFNSLPDPYLLLGYPISEEKTDPATNKTVQYFQLGRLELNPAAPVGQRVSISRLGAMVYSPGAQEAPNANSGPTCRAFSQTGKNVCFAFLQFFDKYGGAATLGNPISNVEIRDGRMVQYFENARLEWRPEKANGHRVGLTPLGQYYLDKVLGESARSFGAVPLLAEVETHPTEVISRAFVANSLLPANSEQKLYVVVQNQKNLAPVSQAMVSVIVTPPDGRTEYYRAPVTNQNGISEFSFPVAKADVKQIVNVEVVVTINGIEQRTKTWFRIWW